MTAGLKRPQLGRIALVLGGIVLWSLLIFARLGQLQIFKHDDFAQLALQRQQLSRAVLAPRGIIYDSHMDELATSVIVSTVVAEPRRMRNIAGEARRLAAVLEMNPEELQARMSEPSRQAFLVVKRRIDPKDEARVEALKIDGVYLIDENMRVYPNRELASHALGFVNMNGDGGAGLELQYDKELKGREGSISFDVDARRRSFRGKVEQQPVQGHSLALSLDKSIQYIAQRELALGVEKSRASSGIAIAMETDTGRILALANHPGFNCNTYSEYSPEFWRNRSITDMFEPGSTFKVVVAAAALEAGLTRAEEIIDCQMGSITIGNHVFHDHKPYGLLTFSQILEYSSNVGAAKLGMRLGEQRLYEALRTFGFGSKSELDLPGEIVGLVRDWQRWSKLSIGAISFGQEVGVTPLQMLGAINSIASGGFRVRPSMVDRVIDEKGDLVRLRAPERTRIISPETALAVRDAFEGVVVRGTGRAAVLDGYRAAGKTGTAQKIVDGRYSDTKYLASFIGFAPLPNPKLTLLVMIDEPKGKIYGGEVAAPVFQKIMQEALLQLKIPPDKTLPLPAMNQTLAAVSAEDYLANATPLIPLVAQDVSQDSAPEDEVITVRVSTETVVVPDFRGMGKRQVVNRCQELGIRVQPSGSGLAVSQIPPPGAEIPLGEICSVVFARDLQESNKIPAAVGAVRVAPEPMSISARP